MLDQILLRLLLFGLAAGILSGIYACVRQTRPAWLGVSARRLIWLTILLLPVFAFPWPWPVVIPVQTPAWIYEARLPNPAAVFPSSQLTRQADQAWKERLGGQTLPTIFIEPLRDAAVETSEETTAKTADAIAAGANTESSQSRTDATDPVREALEMASRMIDTVRVRTTAGFWLLEILPWIRWLFLLGFVANLSLKLIRQFLSGQRYRRSNRDPAMIENPVWLQELAEIRDQTAQYRQGMLMDAPWPAGLFWQQVNSKARHHLCVQSSDLASQPDEQRQQSLALALDRIHHPDLLILLLYRISSSLFWFTPLAWLPERFFLEDQDLWRQRRIAPGRIDKPTMAGRVSNGVLSLVMLVLICLAIWQNPADVRPDIRQAIIRQERQQAAADGEDSLDVVHTPFYSHGEGNLEFGYGIPTDSSMAVAGELLPYQLFRNDLAGSEPGNSGVFVLDNTGLPLWQLDLNTLPVLGDRETRSQVFYLINSRNLADGSYQAIGYITDYSRTETETKVLLEISADGVLQSWSVIPTSIAEPDLSQMTLLQDGSLMMVDSEVVTQIDPWRPYLSILPSDQAVLVKQNRVNRYHAVGTPVWSANVVSELNDALQLGIWQANMTNAERIVSKILPAADGGFYLVIHERMLIQTDVMNQDLARFLNLATSSYFSGSTYRLIQRSHQASDEIVRISPAGSLMWRSAWPTSACQLQIDQCVVGPDGRLYYAALLQNRSVQQLLPSSIDFYARGQSDARNGGPQTEAGPYDGTGPVYPTHESYRQVVLAALDDDGQFVWIKNLYLEDGAESVNLVLTDDCLTLLAIRNTMRNFLFSSVEPSMADSDEPTVADEELSNRVVWQFDLDGSYLGRAMLPPAKPRDPRDHARHLFIRKGILAVPDSEFGPVIYD